jgi:NAD(P)-dependent dehydrogenase (short-subunit alcohol dehydrogenase family)
MTAITPGATMKLDAQHVLITGASHGVGVDVARECQARGARVTVLGRDKDRLTAVAQEVDGRPLVTDREDAYALDRGDVHDGAGASVGRDRRRLEAPGPPAPGADA